MVSCIGYCGEPQRIYLDSDKFIKGSTITVGIDPFITPCLIFIPNVENEYSSIQIQGNVVKLYVVAYSFSPCPGNGSSFREEFNFFTPDIGEYTLEVNWVGPNTIFPISPDDNFIFLGSINFSVVRGQPVSVSSLNFASMLILILTTFTLGFTSIQKRIES